MKIELKSSNKAHTQNRRLITDMTFVEARDFLLKQESYCNFDLPNYFQFQQLIQDIANLLIQKPLSDSPRDHDNVNHMILNNKDGLYAWRPFELIHPVMYATLVNTITEEKQWEKIIKRFRWFETIPQIQCLSMPGASLTKQSDRAEQIREWWQEVEQKSIELSLDYEFLIRTDIADCYASMYTHSIAWALHTKSTAKRHRNSKNLIGNTIDKCIRDMHQGQTNGIPQGSVVMDVVAELVLGYADSELSKKLKSATDSDYQILRYRDDYRIFTHTKKDGETILKHLTEVMIDLGLKLSPTKTHVSDEVIRSSIKDDKLAWFVRKQRDGSLQRQLLIIQDHSVKYPNSGSVAKALNQFYRRIHKRLKRAPTNLSQLISIVVDIAYHNPRTYPNCAAILSELLNFFDSVQEQTLVIEKILRKFSRIPNTGHLEIWLQRISHKLGSDLSFEEPLCKLVRGENDGIWNNDWIGFQQLRSIMDSANIVDQKIIDEMGPTIPIDEVDLFPEAY